MSVSTPRRPSYQASMSDASGGRRASSSTLGTSFADSPNDKKRRNRTLLRDYYGLGPTKGDPLDIDSPESFNPSLYLTDLTSNAGLPVLLRRETDLLNEIRELDGERQSLVYNHHHELIEASDTIRKMKSRAEALDTSLDSLKTSFERISQLSTSLAATTASTTSTPAVSSRRDKTQHTRATSLATVTETPTDPDRPSSPSPAPAPSPPKFSPLLHLAPLLSLPILLRVLDRTKGDALWGSWEPALRSWEDERIEGVEQIGRECRDVLRGTRRASVSAAAAAVTGRGDDLQ